MQISAGYQKNRQGYTKIGRLSENRQGYTNISEVIHESEKIGTQVEW
jgi:hypothetical protein